MEARDTLMAVIVPVLNLRHFLRRGSVIARALRMSRSSRPGQLSKAAQILKPELG